MVLLKKKKGKGGGLKLPTVDSEPLTNIFDYNLMIYGSPGVGKTTLALELRQSDDRPNLLMLAEDGAKALRCRPVHLTTWAKVEGFGDLLANSEDYGGGILDTAEALLDLAWRHFLKRMSIEHPSEADWGKGWDAVRRPPLQWLKRMLSLPDKAFFTISHSVIGTREGKDGDEFEDIHPNIPGKMLEEIVGMIDVLGYLYFHKGQNWLRIRQTDEIMAKCRLEENFVFTDGTPVDVIPMGTSKIESRDALIAAFNNELDPPPPEIRKKRKLKIRKR